MILVADSGSTKTHWCLISSKMRPAKRFSSKGINPFYQNSNEIFESLQKELDFPIANLRAIYFYGAGCSDINMCSVVERALVRYFKISNTYVYSDLLGASRALCQHSAGIACILGTGSNSCFYDGDKIIDNVSPLGYIIGDEGSGAVLGKKLISDLLKNQLPLFHIQAFFNEYKTSKTEIMENIYRKPFPNRYLAQFTPFLAKHIDYPEIEAIVLNSFEEFIARNILQYKNAINSNIHFTGSIAYYFKNQIIKVLKKYNLKPGTIIQSPMEGLIKYHTQ